MSVLSGSSQSLVGLAGGGAAPEQGAKGATSGQSGLQELAGMLADMLLGSSSDKGGGAGGAGGAAGAGKNSGEDLLKSLKGEDDKPGQDEKSADGTGGGSAKDILTQVLMALFEKILGGDGSKGADGNKSAENGGVSGLGGAKGASGAGGADGGSSVEEQANTLLKSLGEGSLDKSISPTGDGGGQVSQDDKLKELLEMIGQFMDSHPETFGTPAAGAGGGAEAGGEGGGRLK
ncbi:hypothetical protein [Pseudomonas sp. NPDC086278]|uniref:hypothetical protein n=1 Tax=Pseudomonas sp. NPDC086278 TaxID=3390646 RepID=UPI003CFEDA2C